MNYYGKLIALDLLLDERLVHCTLRGCNETNDYVYIDVQAREPETQCRDSDQKDPKIWNYIGQVLKCAQITCRKH